MMANDLAALLDHLKISKAHILGHSMGGRVAMRFGALYPKRTSSVIIEDMEPIARFKPTPERREKALKDAAELATLFKDRKYATRDEMLKALNRWFSSEDAEFYAEKRGVMLPNGSGYLLNFRPDVSLIYASQALSEDLVPVMGKIRAPLLFLSADREVGGAISEKGRKSILARKPKPEFVEFKGIGHDLHKDDPIRFAETVEAFLTKNAPKQ